MKSSPSWMYINKNIDFGALLQYISIIKYYKKSNFTRKRMVNHCTFRVISDNKRLRNYTGTAHRIQCFDFCFIIKQFWCHFEKKCKMQNEKIHNAYKLCVTQIYRLNWEENESYWKKLIMIVPTLKLNWKTLTKNRKYFSRWLILVRNTLTLNQITITLFRWFNQSRNGLIESESPIKFMLESQYVNVYNLVPFF